MPLSDAPRAIRLGVIGTGLAVEQLHWPALRQMPDRFEVVAFANHSRPKAEHFARYSGASMDDYAADYHDLLRRADVEAVLISLPIPLNLPVTREALAAGKHVICEKPSGANQADAEAFLELAEQYPERVLLVAENFFYRDDARFARSLLDEGAIGRLHLVSWRQVSQLVPKPNNFSSTPWRHEGEYQGGPHLDAGVHHTALLRFLCGDVTRLHGEVQDANSIFGGPSDLTLNLRFASGAVGSYTACYPELAFPNEPNDLRLYGDAGLITITTSQRKVTVHRPDGSGEVHRFQADGGYFNEFLNFYEALLHGEPLIADVPQNVRNMQIVLKGLESAEQSRALDLEAIPGGVAESGVPLWRPRGATGLFDGLPSAVETERV
jgi:predicted dehydrogenase